MEVADNFPEECRYVLETPGAVDHYDAPAREQGLSLDERLLFHQEQRTVDERPSVRLLA